MQSESLPHGGDRQSWKISKLCEKTRKLLAMAANPVVSASESFSALCPLSQRQKKDAHQGKQSFDTRPSKALVVREVALIIIFFFFLVDHGNIAS
jgi:hypothetical protein